MSKITTKQYKKIQQVAQRHLAMLYGEFKKPLNATSSFYFWVDQFMCHVRSNIGTWECAYLDENGDTVPVEI